jgi:hypothetical protein
MKQIILILGLLLGSLAYASTDSLPSSDTILVDYKLDAVDELLFSKYAECELKLAPQQVEKLSIQQRKTILGRFFRWIGDFFEPVWGQYREEGHRGDGPYMTFQYNEYSDLQYGVDTIRNRIVNKAYGYDKLYYEIFKTARDGQTVNCTYKDEVCKNANTAKCAAFVYIIGLNFVNQDTITYFSPFTDATLHDSYRSKAENILLNVDVPGLNNTLDAFASLPGIAQVTNGINGLGFLNLMYRSRELLSYLAAFDMLRWRHNIDPSFADASEAYNIKLIAYRLKVQIVEPMYRRCVGFAFYINHNNHTIMDAAALGAAAVVLGDYGGKALFDWDSWPNRWANVANYQIHDVMWREPLLKVKGLQFEAGPLSAPGGTQGFAEGDHYFKITMENLLPYMIAQNNYQKGDYTRGYRKYPIIGLNIFPSPFALYMRTMQKDPDYDNMFKWYRNITMPNGKTACIDESFNNGHSSGILGIKKQTNDGEYLQTYNSSNVGWLGVDLAVNLTPDYLAAIPVVVPWNSIKSVKMMDGTTVLRNKQKNLPANKGYHFLLALAENDIADNSAWHEQSDAGQITLGVDYENLLIDPAKFEGAYSTELEDYSVVGEFTSHNVIYHGVNAGSFVSSVSDIRPITQSTSMHLKGTIMLNPLIFTTVQQYNDYRRISLYQGSGYFYYVVDDMCSNVANNWCEIKFNGNSERYFTLNHTKAKWNFPCELGSDRWGLMAESAATSSTVTYSALQGKHGSKNGEILELETPSSTWGYHKTYSVKNTDKSDMHFITKLTPFQCSTTDNVSTNVYNNDDFGMLYVRVGVPNTVDSIRNYHFVSSSSSVVKAYNHISLKGQTSFISWDDDSTFTNGYCISNTGFRKAGIFGGKLLKYDSTEIIKSPEWIDAHYELMGKYKYQGYIYADTITDVTLYMGDVDYNYLMVAKNKLGNLLSSTHLATDTSKYKYITFNVPAGITEFTLELADPCLVSCFFPPTAITIDTFFAFYQGITETLGHNLDIVKDSGELHIRDGSKVSICPSYYLFNRDSITMKSDEATNETFPLFAAETDLPGGGYGIADSGYLSRLGSKRSMVIVNHLAALILDSGSYTHVGVGATILIRKGGTLYVKKGATLEIGSQSLTGYGELIAEAGAHICIEDSSDLHFFVTSPDTNNTNIFFIPVDQGVQAGVNINAIQSGFKTGGRFQNAVNCLPLCSLWYYLEDYGVNNPDFGTNSLGKPVAKFSLPTDTLCGALDSIIYIDASKSLNEVKYRITATRIGLLDSVYFRRQVGNYAMLTNHEPINISSLGYGTGTIKIELAVENTCGDTDYLAKYIYIPEGPSVSFSLSADTICSGYGSLVANGLASSSGASSIKHEWTVMLIDTQDYAVGDTNQIYYGQVWQFDSSAVSNQFNFPGFRWFGGFNYLVGLKVFGNCDMVAEKWDTVAVPFQVYITSNGLHSTNGNIGYEVNLEGFITTTFDSFVWYPSTLLSNADTLKPYTTSTQDSTLYTLTAYKGACSAVDSIWVKHTEFVNLGLDTVVCLGNEILFGNNLDPSLFIGLLAYADYSSFYTAIEDVEISVTNPSDKLGLFLYDNNYANFELLKATSTALTDLITKSGYLFYSDPSYQEALMYYKTHTLTQSMDFFATDYWPNHSNLTSIIEDQFTTYGGKINFLAQTQGEVFNVLNQFKSSYPSISTSSLWYKNNTQLTSENDWMMIKEQISATTKYTLVVSSSGRVEYDDIMVYVDSVLNPIFTIGSMIDSITIQFNNYTNANTYNNTTSYTWYFGDGDSSFAVNPIHTFPIKDSNYIVCLKATNNCGSYMYCDTLFLSALEIGGFGKKSNHDLPIVWSENQPSTKDKVSRLNYRNYLGNNIPNPYSGNTQIDYELKPNTKDAYIKITNQLGQVIKVIKLYAIVGTVALKEDAWQSGLYYYSLVVDNVIIDSKIMMVK